MCARVQEIDFFVRCALYQINKQVFFDHRRKIVCDCRMKLSLSVEAAPSAVKAGRKECQLCFGIKLYWISQCKKCCSAAV